MLPLFLTNLVAVVFAAAQIAALSTASQEEAAQLFSRASSRAGPYGLNNVQCKSLFVQAKANSMNVEFTNVDDDYSNATYVTQTLLDYATQMTNWTQAHMPSKNLKPFAATYKIKAHYCTPISHAKTNSSLIVAVHGIGFDSAYWDVAYESSYSFVKHAASHGYSTFIYDRIGCGQSEAPSTGGFSAIQSPTEVSVLESILTQLRFDKLVGNKNHGKITLVGHSYGSAQSQAISSVAPNLIEGLVLTGFSMNSSSVADFILSGTLTIANQVSTLPQLQNRPDIWIATASAIADVQQFLNPPYYSLGAANYGRTIANPVTLGGLLTQGAIGGMATNYTGPVFVIDGAADLPFCGRNCYAPAPSDGDQAQAVKALFPATSNFSSFILPHTGHGIALSDTSSEASEQILSFIIANNL